MTAYPKYGIQVKTHPRCKICQSEHRAEIEDVLYLRHAGESLPNGDRPTFAWIEANAESMWGLKMNIDNVRSHIKSHFRYTGAAEASEYNRRQDALEVRDKTRDIVRSTSVDEFLQQVVDAGAAKVAVAPESVTVDQALKASSELTRRKHDATTDGLLAALAGATNAAINKIPDPEPKTVDAEIVDAEVVEVEGPDEPAQ